MGGCQLALKPWCLPGLGSGLPRIEARCTCSRYPETEHLSPGGGRQIQGNWSKKVLLWSRQERPPRGRGVHEVTGGPGAGSIWGGAGAPMGRGGG